MCAYLHLFMCVSMYVSMCVCLYVCVQIYIYVCMNTYISISISIYTYLHTHTHMCIHIYRNFHTYINTTPGPRLGQARPYRRRSSQVRHPANPPKTCKLMSAQILSLSLSISLFLPLYIQLSPPIYTYYLSLSVWTLICKYMLSLPVYIYTPMC